MTNNILSFKSTDFADGDKNSLFVVNFKNGDQLYKWYPKWKDVMQILSDTMATEGILNNGRQLDYLLYTTLYILISRICLEDVSLDTVKLYHKISSLVQTELLNNQNIGGVNV